MIRLIVTYIGMLVLSAAFAIPVLGQEEICEDLQDVHAEHGDDLFEYLSDTGQDCLSDTEPVSTSSIVETGEVIWSEEGSGSTGVPVSLELSQGTYAL